MVREPEKKNKQQHLKTRAKDWAGTKSPNCKPKADKP